MGEEKRNDFVAICAFRMLQDVKGETSECLSERKSVQSNLCKFYDYFYLRKMLKELAPLS